MSQPICDFCSSPDVTDSFNVRDFEMPSGIGPQHISEGGWASCATCAALVRRNQRTELLQRSAVTMGADTLIHGQLFVALKVLHQRFWDNLIADFILIPSDYEPVTHAEFIARNLTKNPRIGIQLAKLASSAATDTEIGPGIEALRRLETKGLLQFAFNKRTGAPAAFTQNPVAANKVIDATNTSTEEIEAAARVLELFSSKGVFNTKTGEVAFDPDHRQTGDKIVGRDVTVAEWTQRSTKDIRRISEDLKMSFRVVCDVLTRMEANRFLVIKFDPDENMFATHILVKDIEVLSTTEQKVARSIARLFGTVFEDGAVKLLEIETPTQSHLKAFSQQYLALEHLLAASARAAMSDQRLLMRPDLSAAENFRLQATVLQKADTFCWFQDTTEAVVSAAVTLPGDMRLDTDLTPCKAGWWYFTMPLGIRTTEDSHTLCAFSWSWTVLGLRTTPVHGILFSGYVLATEDGDTVPVPTTEFFWECGDSITSMVESTRAELTRTTPTIQQDRIAYSVTAIDQIARFFAAGCLWVRQRVLVRESHPVERHLRKRMERERKDHLRPFSDIQVIQLRRREVIAAHKTADSEAKTVNWSCRWIVGGTQGFWRMQRYKNKEHPIPIHINPYVKGPKDKPLKVHKTRVYTVNR